MTAQNSLKLQKQRIAFIHSETRSYRVPLFDILSKNYNVHFYFMYGAGWSAQYPESKTWKYTDLKRFPFIGYSSDFSPGIIFPLFKKYDVIITSGLASFSTHISFLIAKLTMKKFIVWDETWDWPKTFFAKLALPYVKLIVRKADACIAAGSMARKLYLNFGAKPEKVFIAPNVGDDFSKINLNHKKLETLRKKHHLEGKKVILYLSRIVEYKGLDYLIKAFAEVQKKEKNAFLLVGGEGNFRKKCEQLARELSLKNIRFIGNVFHDDVHYYHALCDVFVLPSRHLYSSHECSEAWGLVLNEAMSMGKPVISTTAVAGAYDLIVDGKNGYQVQEKDSHALAEKILFILKNKKSSDLMSLESRKIIKQFTPEKQFAGFRKAIASLRR